MRFLGTSAGEGTPTPFCRCEICQNARRVGGKELRLRSAFLLDEENAVDLGHDSVAIAQKLGIDFYPLQNIFYTHTHSDHFDPTLLWTRSVSPERLNAPLNVWMSEEAKKALEQHLFTSRLTADARIYMSGDLMRVNALPFYEEHDCGDYIVTPMKGFHRTAVESNSANYIFKSKATGKTLFYALDTSFYPEEAFERLKDFHLDTVITECTFPFINGDFKGDLSNHMDYVNSLRFLDKLYTMGVTDEKTTMYVTHITPFGATHEQLCKSLASINRPYKVGVAYDGLTFE